MAPNANSNAKNTPKSFQDALNWPSPTVSDVHTGNLKSTQQKLGSMHSVTLPQAITKDWRSPQAAEAAHPGRTKSHPGSQVNLASQVWPTPAMPLRGVSNAEMNRNSPDLLNTVVKVSAWPTPGAADAKTGYQHRHEGAKGTQENLETKIKNDLSTGQPSSQDPARPNTTGNHQGSSVLSADWVEALMDVPAMWTDCDFSETESIPLQPPQPS
jgi:hypothetical protein